MRVCCHFATNLFQHGIDGGFVAHQIKEGLIWRPVIGHVHAQLASKAFYHCGTAGQSFGHHKGQDAGHITILEGCQLGKDRMNIPCHLPIIFAGYKSFVVFLRQRQQ